RPAPGPSGVRRDRVAVTASRGPSALSGGEHGVNRWRAKAAPAPVSPGANASPAGAVPAAAHNFPGWAPRRPTLLRQMGPLAPLAPSRPFTVCGYVASFGVASARAVLRLPSGRRVGEVDTGARGRPSRVHGHAGHVLTHGRP